jgi:hypothetical protein
MTTLTLTVTLTLTLTLLKIDKNEAVEAYTLASKLYSDLRKPDVAATLERKIALLHYSDCFWEEVRARVRG